MYTLSMACGRCTFLSSPEEAGRVFSEALRRRRIVGKTPPSAPRSEPVAKTSQLYSIPSTGQGGAYSKECQAWPKYRWGRFDIAFTSGESMLDLIVQEAQAVSIVILISKLSKETYGGNHHYNWKKVGLSYAYFKSEAVSEASLPTDRCRAAFKYLMENNKFYKYYQDPVFLF